MWHATGEGAKAVVCTAAQEHLCLHQQYTIRNSECKDMCMGLEISGHIHKTEIKNTNRSSHLKKKGLTTQRRMSSILLNYTFKKIIFRDRDTAKMQNGHLAAGSEAEHFGLILCHCEKGANDDLQFQHNFVNLKCNAQQEAKHLILLPPLSQMHTFYLCIKMKIDHSVVFKGL